MAVIRRTKAESHGASQQRRRARGPGNKMRISVALIMPLAFLRVMCGSRACKCSRNRTLPAHASLTPLLEKLHAPYTALGLLVCSAPYTVLG